MKKLTLIAILTLLAACSPKKNSVSSVATISGVDVGAQCSGGNVAPGSQIGAIYDSTATSYNFDMRVKELLSVNLQPNEVGSVSASDNSPDKTGVRFSGSIKLDSSGNVVGAQSSFKITVYDSFIFSGGQPIEIKFNPSANNGASISGQFNTSNGDGYISMRDSFGEIRFTGKIDAQRFSGTVSFVNTTNVTGGAPISDTLGQFYILRCGFIQ